MAVLGRLCFSSATYLSTESPLLSLNSRNQSNFAIHNLCFCGSPSSFQFLSLSLAHSPNFRNTETRNFVLKFTSTSPEQVLDSSPANVSAETEAETEEFSKTRLLASNVPWSSTPEDIRSLFERHGKVVDVELSMYNKTRNRGLAFIEMGSPEEALAALNNLESYEYEGRTIKVDYARPKKKKTPPPVQPKPVTFNLFVANLSFEARAKHLKEFFESGSSGVVSAEAIFHDNPRKSSGYGFVSFKSKKEADAALSEFQGKIFMGRPLRVARSRQFVKQPVEGNVGSEDASPELNGNGEIANDAA
ncbi:hypothetical protein L6164_030624 [Bauhinia variegata]|uniref:Uncharacterized protein n=1 Tax=Bauhinia variegata TaxID=167791 RepID=A0ACB9LCW6_BAUVA|nr:hypothetical protein L6164_030624 [Bauhinia variegata]